MAWHRGLCPGAELTIPRQIHEENLERETPRSDTHERNVRARMHGPVPAINPALPDSVNPDDVSGIVFLNEDESQLVGLDDTMEESSQSNRIATNFLRHTVGPALKWRPRTH